MGADNIVRGSQDIDREEITENIIANQNMFVENDNDRFAVVVLVEDNNFRADFEFEFDDHVDEPNQLADEHSDVYDAASSSSSDFGFVNNRMGYLIDFIDHREHYELSDVSRELSLCDYGFSSNSSVKSDLSFVSLATTYAATPDTDFDRDLPKFMTTLRRYPYVKKTERNNLGRRKSRYLDNTQYLETMNRILAKTDDDEDGTIGRSVIRFSKLSETLQSEEAFALFVNGCDDYTMSDDVSKRDAKKGKRKRNGRKKRLSSADEAFNNLTQAERSFFNQRNTPLGIINYLDSSVFSFFQNYPTSVFISDPLSSFERMIMHGIAHYYNLRSISFDDKKTNTRLLSISNPIDLFKPSINFSAYLEELHRKK